MICGVGDRTFISLLESFPVYKVAFFYIGVYLTPNTILQIVTLYRQVFSA